MEIVDTWEHLALFEADYYQQYFLKYTQSPLFKDIDDWLDNFMEENHIWFGLYVNNLLEINLVHLARINGERKLY